MPVVVRTHRDPASLLEVADDDRLVDVDAVGDSSAHDVAAVGLFNLHN